MEKFNGFRFICALLGTYWVLTYWMVVMNYNHDTYSLSETSMGNIPTKHTMGKSINKEPPFPPLLPHSINDLKCFKKNDKMGVNHCPPDYLLIGFPKCGSSSMWRYLKQHPQIRTFLNGTVKEAQFWWHQSSISKHINDRSLAFNIDKRQSDHLEKVVANVLTIAAGLQKYQSQFPLITSEERSQDGIILGEHSPGVVWRVPYRCARQVGGIQAYGCNGYDNLFGINATILNIQHFLPAQTKILLILRDPIKRAYSHYWHFYKYMTKKTVISPEHFDVVARQQVSKLNACFSSESPDSLLHPRVSQTLPLQAEAVTQHLKTVDSSAIYGRYHSSTPLIILSQKINESQDMLGSNSISFLPSSFDISNIDIEKELAMLSQRVHEGDYIHPYDESGTQDNPQSRDIIAVGSKEDHGSGSRKGTSLEVAACAWGLREGQNAAQMTHRTISLGLYSAFISVWLDIIPNHFNYSIPDNVSTLSKSNRSSEGRNGKTRKYCVVTLEQLSMKSKLHSEDDGNSVDNQNGEVTHLTKTMSFIEKCIGVNPITSYPLNPLSQETSPSMRQQYINPDTSINRQGSIAPSILPETHAFLAAFYKPFNKKLLELDVLFEELPLPDWLSF